MINPIIFPHQTPHCTFPYFTNCQNNLILFVFITFNIVCQFFYLYSNFLSLFLSLYSSLATRRLSIVPLSAFFLNCLSHFRTLSFKFLHSLLNKTIYSLLSFGWALLLLLSLNNLQPSQQSVHTMLKKIIFAVNY